MSNAFNIREFGVLVRFNKKGWGITRKDKKATAELENRFNIEPGMADGYKKILNPNLPEYKAPGKIQDAFGNYLRGATSCWDDGGNRFITTAGLASLQSVEQTMRFEFDAAVDAFKEALPRLIDDIANSGNGLFDRSMYPTPEEIGERFVWSFSINVIPDTANTMLALADNQVAAIREASEADMIRRVEDATVKAHDSVFEILDRASRHLKEFGDNIDGSKRSRSFNNNLIEKVIEASNLLPGLNITGNPKMDALGAKIADTLSGITAADLKGEKRQGVDKRSPAQRDAEAAKLREATAAKTDDLLDDLASVFG
ncbi:MAG: hypothetical protein HOE83_23375 [Alphaproteobacteria bacterium]|jgi:hypothetical protein|nr:hypothetical protein [Alphaproteobacteria bacterium]